MSNIAQNECLEHKPTLQTRWWRMIGYRYQMGVEPEGSDALSGWMRSDIRLHFGWRDRLRLLLTGKLFISSIVMTDTPSPTICKSRVDWRIIETGGDWR